MPIILTNYYLNWHAKTFWFAVCRCSRRVSPNRTWSAAYSISGSFCTLSLYADTFRYFNMISVSIKTSNWFLSRQFMCDFFPLESILISLFHSLSTDIVNPLYLLLYWFKRAVRFVFLFVQTSSVFFFCCFFSPSSHWAILMQVWRFRSTKRFYGHHTCFYCCPCCGCFLLLLIRDGICKSVCLVIFEMHFGHWYDSCIEFTIGRSADCALLKQWNWAKKASRKCWGFFY